MKPCDWLVAPCPHVTPTYNVDLKLRHRTDFLHDFAGKGNA